MNRNKHTFQFSGSAIAEAAGREAEYHGVRLAWWTAEQDKATRAAKEKGIEIREYDVTGGKRAEMVIDATLQGRLTECANKIYAHRKAAEQFRIEAGAYAANPTRVYELDPEDVVYFRLAGLSASQRED
jgi:hypothetical protein